MQVKLSIDLGDGTPAREMTTNMLAIVDWEKQKTVAVQTAKASALATCAAGHLRCAN